MATIQSNALSRPTAAAGAPTTMTAVDQDGYGPTNEEVLRVAQIELPIIGDDEVLLRVHAASVYRAYPLEDTAAAIRHLLDGKARGTVVVSVSPSLTQTPPPGSTP